MECRLLTESDIAAAPDWLDQVDLRRTAGGMTRPALLLAGRAAVGRIFASRVHTSRYWTAVVVAPEACRRGYGRQMVTHLAGLRPEPKPLCTRGYISSDGVLFSRSLGAQPYQTCPPQAVETADAVRLSVGEPPTLPGSAVGWEELQQAWVDIYAWVHASWSPVAPGFEESLLVGFTDDLDLAHTRVPSWHASWGQAAKRDISVRSLC